MQASAELGPSVVGFLVTEGTERDHREGVGSTYRIAAPVLSGGHPF